MAHGEVGDGWIHPAVSSTEARRAAARGRSDFTSDSELLRDAGLFEDGVGGVSGLDSLIDDEVVIRDRTEPDFVITLSLPLEAAGVLAQHSLELLSERLSHSGGQRHELLPVAGQLKRDTVARNVSGE